ncbi:putative lipopolysaccharide biosynthesis O-acetyl transferase WbbJ [Vibrio chagasii]|nr:putative lipopolysaccharide biosynthesis O-acetyl transferase WbbJ [Vibrio chagasii]CAH7411770.1 putative lipopolysaccharide biosynthesis O-acetyl transferase WbbJ [Vibrio chagasii]CAH7430080.1 putative lipopolysaccharide biosynthesis O-acetyl transferase WbbJ [Vibrio chagasii]
MRNFMFKYGIFGFLKLLSDYMKTRLFFKSSRLIRHPIDVRGKSSIDFGFGLTTGRYCRLETYGSSNNNEKLMVLGERCQINDFVHITATNKVIIGNDVLIASKVYISDTNHGNYSGENQSDPSEIVSQRALSSGTVIIGDNTWICEGVSILSNVTLGCNVIIAANSVVTKSFPDDVILAGSPAKIIKKYNHDLKIWELQDGI